MKHCIVCDKVIRKDSWRSWTAYNRFKFCSTSCSNEKRNNTKIYHRPTVKVVMMYKDYLQKHCDQL